MLPTGQVSDGSSLLPPEAILPAWQRPHERYPSLSTLIPRPQHATHSVRARVRGAHLPHLHLSAQSPSVINLSRIGPRGPVRLAPAQTAADTAGPQLSAHHVRLIGLTRIFGLSHRWVWDPAVVAADWSRIGSVRLLQHRHRLSWEANLSFRESDLWPVPPGAESRIPQAPLVSVGSVWLRDARGWHRSRAEPLVRLAGILARIPRQPLSGTAVSVREIRVVRAPPA